MAISPTLFMALSRQAKADTGWHTALNTTLEKVDRGVGASGFYDPNLDHFVAPTLKRAKVTVEYVGQYWYRRDNHCVYRGTAVGVPGAGGVWTREVPRGATCGFLGDIGLLASYKGWVLANGQTVNLQDAEAATLETIVVPNARGRVIIAYDDSLGDADYDTIAELSTLALKKYTVKEENILQFTTAIGSPHTHNYSVPESTGESGIGGGTGFTDRARTTTPEVSPHTHVIGKPVGPTLIELDNRPPYIVAGLLYRL